jgi:hypothetical protein
MAQMRIKDQDLIVEQVVNKIESIELEKLKARKDVQEVQANAEAKIEVISRLVEQYNELEETIKAEKKELKTLVESFQEANELESSYSTDKGIYLNDGYHTNTVPTTSIVWKMNWGQKGEISTKLRLQTMGGDFNAYELIEQLVNEFSN